MNGVLEQEKRSRSAVFRRENFRIGGSLLNPRYYDGERVLFVRSLPRAEEAEERDVGEAGRGGETRHLHPDDCRRIELQRKLIRRRVMERRRDIADRAT